MLNKVESTAEHPRKRPLASTNADIAEKSGEILGEGKAAATSPSLGRSTVLSTKAAPRQGDIPYSPDAEYHLLGMVFFDEWTCWGEEVEKIVSAEDFFFPEHKAIWRAMRWLFDRGDPVTIPTVAYALEQMGVIDACDKWIGHPGTEPYLVYVQTHVYTSIGCAAVARIIKHYSDLRRPLNTRRARETEI